VPALYDVDPKAIAIHEHRLRYVSLITTVDSDLEAFSHYPADDSFAALAVQPTALPAI
jgi:hypothetical protein